MKQKGYLLIFSILFCCFFLQSVGQEQNKKTFSQSLLRGVVRDKQNNPLPFATVSVSLETAPSRPIKGTITSQEGVFSLELPANRDFLITIRFLGYQDTVCQVKTNASSIDLGDFILSPQSQLLEGVTVRSPISITADKIVYNFENEKDRATSNMMNMIRRMPLILVDDFTGQIYIESQEKTYIILRNGKPDALFSGSAVKFEDMLKKLPAMGFTQFEIWQQPPPRYKNCDYVINIIADKNQRLFGAVGASNAEHEFNQMTTRLKQGVTGSADHLRFTGNVNFGNEAPPQNKQFIHSRYPATTSQEEVFIDQEKKSRRDIQRYGGNLNLSYDLSKLQFINVNATYNRTIVNNNQYLFTDSSTRNIHNRFSNESLDRTIYSDLQLGVNYQYDFVPGSRILNMSYSLTLKPVSNTQETNRVPETTTDASYAFNREKDAENTTQKFQINYMDNFANSKFNLDLDLGYLIKNYKDQSQSYNLISQLEDRSLHSRMQQNLHRIDGAAELKWNPTNNLCLTGKLIADYLPENNRTTLIYDQYVEQISQQAWLYSPAFSVRYTFKTPSSRELDFIESLSLRSNIEFFYTLIKNRPDPKQMSNYKDISNPQWIQQGNPELKPESVHSLIFRVSLGFANNLRIIPGFNYSKSQNKIMPYSFAQTTEHSSRIVNSYTNAEINNLGARLSIGYKTMLHFLGNFNYTKMNIHGEKNSNSSIYLMGSYHFDALKFIRISSILGYANSFLKGARGTKYSYPFSLGFNLTPKPIKIRDNDLRASLAFHNVLNWKNSKAVEFVNTSTLEMETTSFKRNLPIMVTLSYSFGKFKTKPLKQTRKKAEVRGFSE